MIWSGLFSSEQKTESDSAAVLVLLRIYAVVVSTRNIKVQYMYLGEKQNKNLMRKSNQIDVVKSAVRGCKSQANDVIGPLSRVCTELDGDLIVDHLNSIWHSDKLARRL